MSQPKNNSNHKGSSKRKAVAFTEDTKNAGAASRTQGGSSSAASGSKRQKPAHHSYLDPPSFRLPASSTNDSDDDDDDDAGSSRYELWTVRLPAELNVHDLQGLHLRHEQTLESSSTHGTTYLVQLGHATENESFRVLVPEEMAGTASSICNDEGSDDDDDSFPNQSAHGQPLVPAALPFTRHWNIAVLPPPGASAAPSREQAPPPLDILRRAYGPVPQHAHLKRRWMPPGCGRVVMGSPTTTAAAAKMPTASLRIKQEEEEVVNGGAARAQERSSKRDMTEHPASKRIKLEDPNDDKSDPKSAATLKRAEHDVHSDPTEDGDGDNNNGKRIKAETKEERKARKVAKKAKKEKKKKVKKEEEGAVDS